MKYLRVKNLEKHQHYKDRRPPWIKLHAEVLNDYAFTCLHDASKAHLMLLWVLASRLDNKIPYDLAWITQQLGAHGPVDMEELILQGFMEVFDDGSKLLAPRKQSAVPETETETETESPAQKTRGAVGSALPKFNLAPYIDAHTAKFPGSSPPGARYGKVFKQLDRKHGADETLRRWKLCLEKKALFATPEELAAHWSEYGATGPPKDDDGERKRIQLAVQGRRARHDGDAWWARMQREANTTNGNDLYRYAVQHIDEPGSGVEAA